MNQKQRNLLCLFLCAILLLGIFSGCQSSSQENSDSAAQAYIDMAQEYIDNGNYASAIDVLQKGYSSTGDERINTLLQAVLSIQSSNSSTEATQTPVTEPSVTEPPVTEPPVTEPPSSPTLLYTHSGTISINTANITLQDNAVLYVTLSYAGSVSYTYEPSNIMTLTWGEFDHLNTIPLYITASQNGTARIRIFETNYPDNYLTVNVTVSNHVSIDTSKASGIFAQAGITEQEFRNMCQPLVQHSYLSMYGSITGPTVGRLDQYHVAYGKQYYEEHPEDKEVDAATEEWLKIYVDYLSGGDSYTGSYGYGNYSTYHLYTKYQDLDTYLLHTVYAPKGEHLLEESTSTQIETMKEYPNNFVGMPFVFLDFNFDSIIGTTYIDNNYSYVQIEIYDLRDDVNAPNIIKSNDYYLYAIFEGTYTDYNGDIVLTFSLLSLEKI